MKKPAATKKEVLLAVAMSSYYKTNHINYMPIGKEFTRTLDRMRSTKMIVPMGENFYTLTSAGRKYLAKQDVVALKDADREVDTFIKNI